MSILVTGGAGFIGSHLVRSLLAAGESVIVYDNVAATKVRTRKTPRLRVVLGDVRDRRTLAKEV